MLKSKKKIDPKYIDFQTARSWWFSNRRWHLAWREESDRGGLHADRVLRAARAFFDALAIAGAVSAKPLRAVQPLAPPGATNADDVAQRNRTK